MDTDIENGLGDTVGGREWGNGEICIHALSGINWITGEKLLYTGSPVWSSGEKKITPGHLYFSKNFQIILICIWILKSVYRFFC